jgi:ABC-type siderophore export system fused ATPase/permease subunit
MGVISGGSNAALLAMINHLLSTAAPSSNLFIIFFALCIILPITRFASEAMLINLSSKAVLELRMRLSLK